MARQSAPSEPPAAEPSAADDLALLAAHIGGDPRALPALMARYDTVVRFAIHRYSGTLSRRDPDWLDSMASTVWTGLIDSLTRDLDNLPASVKAYLLQIARNQTIDAIRRVERRTRLEEKAALSVPDAPPDPADIVAEFEQIEALRRCVDGLSDADKDIYAQVDLIVARRWREAAAALGVAESTLRSRWKRILADLKACMGGRAGGSFAPRGSASD